MGPFVNSVACLQKDHKKYPNLFCFVWLVNPEDSEKGLDIFLVWISNIMQTRSLPFSHDVKYLQLPDIYDIFDIQSWD